MAPLILMAGLDSRGLLLEAPMLQRDREMVEERSSARELLDGLARAGGRLVILGPDLADLPLAEAVRRIRSLPATRQVSVLVVLPAEEPAGLEDLLRESGANAVLRRPLDPAHLETWIAKLLSVPRRVEARFPVEGQVVGTPRASATGHFYGLSRNLSVHGMLLASPVRLADAPDLDIEFHLPEGGRVRALGRVVRDASEVAWPYLGYGVEFLFVPPDGRDAIVKLVSRAGAISLGTLSPEAAAARVQITIRQSSWIYEILEPVKYPAGWLVEIRRAPGEGWRPGLSGPFYVVEGSSSEAALEAAREFVNRNG